jgi:diguanylate cyclase (GGDEF)-like protein
MPCSQARWAPIDPRVSTGTGLNKRENQRVALIPTQHHQSTHPQWRVILVGRTGLDQILRRDAAIELIRARDTIDAIGELSDPIDTQSPAQAIVLVAASIEPMGEELESFIAGLRLIDPQVRVLGVGSHKSYYDGWIESQASLAEIIDAIENAKPIVAPAKLRFVDPSQVSSSKPDLESKPEPEPEPESGPDSEPEVVIVARNEDFTHRAQESFEDESEIHQQILIGSPEPEQSSPSEPEPGVQIPVSIHRTTNPMGAGQMLDDQPLVEAMIAGRSVLESAIDRINLRLAREDIVFVPQDQQGQQDQSADTTGTHSVEVLVGSKPVGRLVCTDPIWGTGVGRESMTQQAQWLATWIKLEIQQRELRNAAFTDSLTGAWNRRYFSRFLDAAIKQARIARQPLSVMVFDIDGFKHYNDTYGHSAGDEILIETVKLLKSVIRPSDRVCRVGGDEFAVIFYEPQGPRDPESKPLESVYQIAKRFQQQICTHRFPKLGAEALGTLTVSGGLASYPWDGHDADSLLEQADMLAIESKRNGKNAMTLGPGAETICACPPPS